MNGISDVDVINALRRQMTIAAARQAASAGNLANVDTPNYKAVDVTFADTLDAAQVAPARRDGNTVVLDQELLKMSRAAGDFSAAQTALAAKFRLVRYAINEGR
jgi:flagellar basal-body rod protein FlgB